MTKLKISATLDPDQLAEAKALIGTENVSELLGTALVVPIERELERRWLTAHPDHDLPQDVPVDLKNLPWDES